MYGRMKSVYYPGRLNASDNSCMNQARLEETPCRVFGQLLWKHDKCDPSRRKRRP